MEFDPKKAKHINNGDPWMLAEDIPDIDFHFSQIWLSMFVNDSAEPVRINYKKILCVYNGYNLKFYYGEKDSNEIAESLLQKIISNPSFGELINSEIRRLSATLRKFSEKLEPAYLKNIPNEEFTTLLKELDEVHTELYTWGWLPNAVDMFHANFTNYLKNLIARRLPEDRVSISLMILSTSAEKSIVQQEHESLLKLVVLKQENVFDVDFEKALSDHVNRYFYFKHLWIGKDGVYDRKHYLVEIEKVLNSGTDASELLIEEERSLQEILLKRNKLSKEINLSEDDVRVFNIYADFAVTKLIRRDAQLFWAYKMDFVFAELSNRLGISVMEARFLMPQEMYNGLENGIPETLKSTLAERTKHCVYYAEKGVDIVVTGKDCEFFEETIIQEEILELTEFKGQTACVGKVTGVVKIVNVVADIKKVNNGDILVSIATNPDVLPAMKKAIAFVTEQGGITSHAAIVAREMKKPCIIGTKIATKILKDGDLVEVDANKGVVKILKKTV